MNPFTFSLAVLLPTIALSSVLPSAVSVFGQFPTNYTDGQSYTTEDIAQGKGPRNMQTVQISSESMLPLYEVGESVTLDYDYPYESLVIGDVVAFIPHGNSVNCDTGLMCDYVMHRIIAIDNETFTTKGDNNDKSMSIEENISKSQYVGKIVETESY